MPKHNKPASESSRPSNYAAPLPPVDTHYIRRNFTTDRIIELQPASQHGTDPTVGDLRTFDDVEYELVVFDPTGRIHIWHPHSPTPRPFTPGYIPPDS